MFWKGFESKLFSFKVDHMKMIHSVQVGSMYRSECLETQNLFFFFNLFCLYIKLAQIGRSKYQVVQFNGVECLMPNKNYATVLSIQVMTKQLDQEFAENNRSKQVDVQTKRTSKHLILLLSLSIIVAVCARVHHMHVYFV